jgi:uncharacterized protein
MKWQGRRQSDNLEDRRGMSGKGKAIAGGGMIGIVVLLLNIFGGETGRTIAPMLEQFNQGSSTQTEQRELTASEKEEQAFVATVLADNEDVWTKIFQENGMSYKKPKVILFSGGVDTACGSASSASGPFYCPGDQNVYMDLTFFEELKTRFGAQGGDFATAYVIEVGDLEEALSAAHAVGDDAIQAKMQGHIVPESFTHGTSEQRKYWFMRGYNTGDIRQGDTFSEVR